MLVKEELYAVRDFIWANHELLNKPNKANKIKIMSNKIYIIKNSQISEERELDIPNLSKTLSSITYTKNVFMEDISLSPLEADRNEYAYIWKQKYSKINFPIFISVALACLFVTGKMPEIIDFCKIYLLSYTTVLKTSSNSGDLYNVKYPGRRTLDKKILVDNIEMTNRLIRFNDIALNYTYGLPINEFTTFDICARIVKVYGSIVRDISNPIRFSQFTDDVEYDFYQDLCGIDMFLAGIPVFVFVKTDAGNEFRAKKVLDRHPNLEPRGIILQFGIPHNFRGIYYPTDEFIKSMIANSSFNSENEFKTFTY